LEETSTITFNSSELILHGDSLSVTSEALKTEQTQSVKLTGVDQKSERASVQISTPLPKGSKAKLRIGYEGKLTGSMLGTHNRAILFRFNLKFTLQATTIRLLTMRESQGMSNFILQSSNIVE
jgi:hypothetical protein